MRAGLRLFGGIILGLATVGFGTFGIAFLVLSRTWGGSPLIAVALLGAAAASGGALATLLRQDRTNWP